MHSVLLVGLLLTASAEDPDLAHAIAMYEAAELDRAEPLLRLLAEKPALSNGDRTLALEYVAATHFALGMQDKARDDLKRLIAHAPDAKLDPQLFDPKLVQLHTSLEKQALATNVQPEPSPKPEPKPQPLPKAEEQVVKPGPTAESPGLRRYALIPAAVAVAAGAFGAFEYTQAAATSSQLRGGSVATLNEGNALVAEGKQQQALMTGAFVVAGAAAAASVVMFLLPANEETVAVAPGLGSVNLAGRF